MKSSKFIVSLAALSLTAVLASGCSIGNKEETTQTTEEATIETTEATESVDLNALDLPQLSKDIAKDESAVEMNTTEGKIKIKLFPKQAPKAVENFMKHAKDGYYDDVKFHRIIEDFMIQTGDPKGDGTGGESIWKEEFAPEISNQLYHINGALAMARTAGDIALPTQGSQFYIVQNDKDVSDGLLLEDYPEKIIEAYKKGGVPFLDFQYSVFGQVIDGMDVVNKIAKTKVENSGQGEQSKPKKDIKIKGIKIIQEAK
ncbi:peptidylprolyl isomerase [Vagococcus fessus]|uniref:Peptidyl-prolyl cis-trans isomerase n=1 Tax=Vagococcus fessus TaxID=120370 RepID=A0A430ACR9_9ENTE|nr:peptidylprolyl isomerase [Vagococcus fessus]RSU05017.1 peptidylprolyl isomerase [Vagococcus fessus]